MHFVFSSFLFKNCAIYKNVKKYCRAGQATVDSVANTHFMLDTYGYTQRDYIMFIAFPLHHWLHECASVLDVHSLSCCLCFFNDINC